MAYSSNWVPGKMKIIQVGDINMGLRGASAISNSIFCRFALLCRILCDCWYAFVDGLRRWISLLKASESIEFHLTPSLPSSGMVIFVTV